MQLFVQFFGELFLASALAFQGTGNVVATVSDTLYLGNLSQHRSYLHLGVVAKVRRSHLIQIIGNLNFHAIADAFVFLYSIEYFNKLAFILFVKQVSHHPEHALHTSGERPYLLMCLQNRKLWRLHDARLDELQTEVFLVIAVPWLDQHAYQPFYLRDEPYQNSCIHDVERRVEGRQDDRQFYGQLLLCQVVSRGVVVY